MQAVALRLPDRRGAGAHALLRRGVVGRAVGLDRLRGQDAVGGGAADPPPQPPASVAEVHAVIVERGPRVRRGAPPPRAGSSPGSPAPARPRCLFCAAVAISGGVLLTWLSDLTFWRDEWAFILNRRGSGLDTYLDPFVEQLLAIPVAIYKLLIAIFGIESPIPFQVASTLVFLDQRRGPVRLPAPAGRGVAGARRRAPDPLPRAVLGRPAVPVSDQLLRLDGVRPRRAAWRSIARIAAAT